MRFEAAHFSRLKIGDNDDLSADEFFGLVVFGKAGEYLPRLVFAKIDLETEEFVSVRYTLGDLNFSDTQLDL